MCENRVLEGDSPLPIALCLLQEELTRVNTEIKKILAEIESSVKDAVKSEESLQEQLAAKNAEAARLAAEIEASKVRQIPNGKPHKYHASRGWCCECRRTEVQL